MTPPGFGSVFLLGLASLVWCGWLLRILQRDKAYLPFLIFVLAYFGLFYLGALGIQLDAKGYFEDWIASIGVQEAYLDSKQAWTHLIGIHLPFFGLGVGALWGHRTAPKFLSGWQQFMARNPTLSVSCLFGGLTLGLYIGSFAFSLALLLVFCAGILGGPTTRAKTSSLLLGVPRSWAFCFLLFWGLAAFLLFSHNALGSIFTYATRFNFQDELSRTRTELVKGLPIFYWSLSYSILPTLGAACIWSLPRHGLKSNLLKFVIFFATLWIVFAHFFKGQAFFYFFYLAFCTAVLAPRQLFKIAGLVTVSAILLLGGFYGYLQISSGSDINALQILQHFLYRLGTNQYFYVLVFPSQHPWLPLDIGHLGNVDSHLSYLFQYPTQQFLEGATSAGPYISNAYAQGGNQLVLAYSLVSGFLLQSLWSLGSRLKGPLQVAMLGRVLFLAFMLSQASFRDSLASGWGIIWGLFPIVILKWLFSPKSIEFLGMDGLPPLPNRDAPNRLGL